MSNILEEERVDSNAVKVNECIIKPFIFVNDTDNFLLVHFYCSLLSS
jgi:hypothetical protein